MSSIPSPKNRYPGDLFMQMQKDPLAFLVRHHQDYPDIYGWRAFRQEMVVLGRPDLVQRLLTGHPTEFEKGIALQRSRVLLGNGLLTAEGEDHLRSRRMLQPAFRKARVHAYGELMIEETLDHLDGWKVGLYDVHKEMMELALKIVCQTLVGRNVRVDGQTVSDSLEPVLNNFRLTLLPFFSLLRRLPIPQIRKLNRDVDNLIQLADDLVARCEGVSQGSILELLEGEERQQKVDQVLTLLLAGHETTANTLTFCLHLLAKNSDIQEHWQRELDEVLDGRPPTVEDYSRLPFTRRVIEETLRLYPPAWVVGRRNLLPVEWDGFEIKQGSVILAPQWVLHRDSRFFPDPNRFDPDRWIDLRPDKGAYFPFGGGARVCIGEGFARMEALLILAILGQRFSFALTSKEDPELSAGITLRPQGGLRLFLTERKAAPIAV